MKVLNKVSLLAAVALCAMPVLAAAGEAAPAMAPAREEMEKQLESARQRLDVAVREVADLSGRLGQRFAMQVGIDGAAGGPPRALLGVGIGSGDQKDGAHVMNVSPGGPAAEAGIKEGDVITSIAGLDLTKDSNPSRALVEKMRDLQPDLKVQVGVLRDGKKMNFDVAPRAAPMRFELRREGPGMAGGPGIMGVPPVPPVPPVPGMRQFDLPGMAGGPGDGRRIERRIEMLRSDDNGTRFRGMEFATLSEKLGGYFGVKAGVLVVRAGVNSPFKLQDGDVILAIDGREATSAQHAGRILRSYQAGEKLTLRVQRDRKAQNIDVTVPSGRDDD